MFSDGKMPNNLSFKVGMAGFGKYLKPYVKCPIKKQFKFERLIPDSKILIFASNAKFTFGLLLEAETIDKQRDFLNFTFTAEIND